MSAATIRLTPAEVEHADWAFGAMCDYWGAACAPAATPDPDAEGVTENDLTVPEGALMPFLTGNVLTLSTWDEVNDDLAQRIGDQLPDMAAGVAGEDQMSHQRAAGIARSCRVLAKAIRNEIERAARPTDEGN